MKLSGVINRILIIIYFMSNNFTFGFITTYYKIMLRLQVGEIIEITCFSYKNVWKYLFININGSLWEGRKVVRKCFFLFGKSNNNI